MIKIDTIDGLRHKGEGRVFDEQIHKDFIMKLHETFKMNLIFYEVIEEKRSYIINNEEREKTCIEDTVECHFSEEKEEQIIPLKKKNKTTPKKNGFSYQENSTSIVKCIACKED